MAIAQIPQTVSLLCHPDCRPPLVAIKASLFKPAGGGLGLLYRLQGAMDEIAVPAPRPTGPADGLWQHTCCEAFVAVAGNPAYREFNFSPSGQWAAYGFTDYRRRDENYQPGAVPLISLHPLADGLELEAILPPELLPVGGPLQLGLTAVVETRDGEKSYWALAHPGLQPDFHLRSAFSLDLAVPRQNI